MPKFEVTLTANILVTVLARDANEAIKKAEGLSLDDIVDHVTSIGFDDDNDIVTNISDFKTPEDKALYHLRKIGINLSKGELKLALKKIREGMK